MRRNVAALPRMERVLTLQDACTDACRRLTASSSSSPKPSIGDLVSSTVIAVACHIYGSRYNTCRNHVRSTKSVPSSNYFATPDSFIALSPNRKDVPFCKRALGYTTLPGWGEDSVSFVPSCMSTPLQGSGRNPHSARRMHKPCSPRPASN